MGYDFQICCADLIFFNDIDVGAFIFNENVPLEMFNIFKSIQIKQQYVTQITYTEVKKKLRFDD